MTRWSIHSGHDFYECKANERIMLEISKKTPPMNYGSPVLRNLFFTSYNVNYDIFSANWFIEGSLIRSRRRNEAFDITCFVNLFSSQWAAWSTIYSFFQFFEIFAAYSIPAKSFDSINNTFLPGVFICQSNYKTCFAKRYFEINKLVCQYDVP